MWMPVSRVMETGHGTDSCEHGKTSRNCESCCRAIGQWCEICGGMPFYMGCLYTGEHYTAVTWIDDDAWQAALARTRKPCLAE